MNSSIINRILLFAVLALVLFAAVIYCAKSEQFDEEEYLEMKMNKKLARMIDQLGLSPKKQARIRNLLKDVLQDPIYNRRQYPVDTFDMDELMDRTDAREAGDNYADDDDEIEFPTDEPRSDVPRAAAMDMPRNEARMSDDEESMPPMHNHPTTTTPTAPTSFWQRTNWYYTTTILVTCVVATVLGILLLVMSWLFCCYNTPKAVAYKNSSPTYLPTTNVNPNVGEYKSPTVVVSSGPNTTPVYQFKH